MSNEPKLNCKLDKSSETLYNHVGGWEVCLALSAAFHDRVAHDPLLREMFPRNMDRLTERFAWFIAERLDGPADYTAKRGKNSLGCRHAQVPIGVAERERWLGHMFEALDEVGIAEPARERLRGYFSETALSLSDSLITLYQLPLDELRTKLELDPSLVAVTDTGQSLLSDAALRWDLERVRLLLEHGADIHATYALGHDALYQATRSGSSDLHGHGRAVVELLIRHGADVNRHSGPGRSTALHMAARRGHPRIAEVLLSAGANLESRDSKGETPLRRAMNCGQVAMVQFLVSRGADPLSRDKNGVTALAAARNEPIRKALQGRSINPLASTP